MEIDAKVTIKLSLEEARGLHLMLGKMSFNSKTEAGCTRLQANALTEIYDGLTRFCEEDDD